MLFYLLPLLTLAAWLIRKTWLQSRHRQYRGPVAKFAQQVGRRPNARKPEWVRQEVLRRKAIIPDLSCRKLADGFNLEFRSRKMTVGHSWFAVTVKKHADKIKRQRKNIRNRNLGPGPKNRVWGLDLTEISTAPGRVTLLGAVDHGTRACLTLEALGSKATIQILRVLLDIIGRFGKPSFIRTDNEAVFKSRKFRWFLTVFGIRHQLTKVASPWQNGRIERLFGTLKERWAVNPCLPESWTDLVAEIQQFRTWYNHLRPHQNLGGLPPAWVWDGKTKRSSSVPAEYVEAWDGAIAGFYLRP